MSHRSHLYVRRGPRTIDDERAGAITAAHWELRYAAQDAMRAGNSPEARRLAELARRLVAAFGAYSPLTARRGGAQ